RDFEGAMRRAPDDPWLVRGLGLAFAEREIEVRAVAILRLAAEMEPEHAETWYWIGQLAPRDTHADLALSAFERATELQPEVADYWAARAGREQGARALWSLKIALEVEPDNVEALTTSAWLYDHLGRFEEAVEAHRKVVALRRTPRTLRALGRALHAVDLHDEGAATAHDALTLESAPYRGAIGPVNGNGAFGLVARLLLERGRLEGLRRYYLQRGSSIPVARDFWWSMAAALTERGRHEDALKLLDQLAPDNSGESSFGVRLYRDRAIVLEALGRTDDSRTAWEMMRMHRDFARFERSGVGALDVGPDGAATLGWETATASIADPWTDRVRPFRLR
ncbi:MAG: hypothetical protein OEM67_11020, partial [Thermoleophilia bacterium]|nr:hypothetical protein [Thermoleophilia bacterium]